MTEKNGKRDFLVNTLKQGLFVSTIETKRRFNQVDQENRKLETKILAVQKEKELLKIKVNLNIQQKEIRLKQRVRGLKEQIDSVEREIAETRQKANAEVIRNMRDELARMDMRIEEEKERNQCLNSKEDDELRQMKKKLLKLQKIEKDLKQQVGGEGEEVAEEGGEEDDLAREIRELRNARKELRKQIRDLKAQLKQNQASNNRHRVEEEDEEVDVDRYLVELVRQRNEHYR